MACRRGPMLTRRPKTLPRADRWSSRKHLPREERLCLTGDVRIDRSLLALARLLADIAGNPRAISPSTSATEEDGREDGHG